LNISFRLHLAPSRFRTTRRLCNPWPVDMFSTIPCFHVQLTRQHVPLLINWMSIFPQPRLRLPTAEWTRLLPALYNVTGMPGWCPDGPYRNESIQSTIRAASANSQNLRAGTGVFISVVPPPSLSTESVAANETYKTCRQLTRKWPR
jgi:hypothetical protein